MIWVVVEGLFDKGTVEQTPEGSKGELTKAVWEMSLPGRVKRGTKALGPESVGELKWSTPRGE